MFEGDEDIEVAGGGGVIADAGAGKGEGLDGPLRAEAWEGLAEDGGEGRGFWHGGG